MKLLLLAVCVIGVVNCYEIVPRASGLKTKGDVRRAPLPSISSFAPLAKSLRPASTGVRRAPEVVTIPVRRAYRPANPAPRAPMTLPTLPLLPPLPLPQFIPVPVPVMTPQELPPLGTLPTLPPHTFPTFTPIPGLPTMPGLTMPPSFQRLLGITTTTMKPASNEERERPMTEDSESEPESKSRAYSSPTYNKDLNTVRSRLSKFVRGSEKKASKAEDNADWIVPFH